jgi:tetratricopeptide (TPR) repeat protein
VYLFVDDHQRATEQANKTLELFPGSLQAYHVLGLAAVGRCRYEDAIPALERAVSFSSDALSVAYLGAAQARAGRCEIACALLQDLLSKSGQPTVPPRCFVFLYASLGDPDRAFEWLERAYETRDTGLFFLRVMPLFDPLHSDPRFGQMLRRVGLSSD